MDEGDLLVSLGLTKPNVEGGNYQVKVFDNPIKSRNNVYFFSISAEEDLDSERLFAIKVFDFELGEYKRDEFIQEEATSNNFTSFRADQVYLSATLEDLGVGVIVSEALQLNQLGTLFFDMEELENRINPSADRDSSQYKAIVHSLASKLADLHSTPTDSITATDVKTDFHFGFEVASYVDIFRDFFLNFVIGYSEKDINELANQTLQAFSDQIFIKYLSDESRYVLSHRDLNHNNLFVSDNLTFEFIDTGNSGLANPEEDLASVILSITSNPLLLWSAEDIKLFESDLIDSYNSQLSGDSPRIDEDIYLAAKVHYGLFQCSTNMRLSERQKKHNANLPIYRNSNPYNVGFADNLLSFAAEAISELARRNKDPKKDLVAELYKGEFNAFGRLGNLLTESKLRDLIDAPWLEIVENIPIKANSGYPYIAGTLGEMLMIEKEKKISLPTVFHPYPDGAVNTDEVMHQFQIYVEPPLTFTEQPRPEVIYQASGSLPVQDAVYV